MLLYTKSRFVQFLEGDYDQIKALYESIKKDERHSNVILVSLQKDESYKRLFPTWAMGGKPLDGLGVHFETKLSSEEKELFHKMLDGASSDHQKITSTINKLFQ